MAEKHRKIRRKSVVKWEYRFHRNRLLAAMSKTGCDLEAIRRLIPRCKKDKLGHALEQAARFGHVEAVRLLIPGSNPKINRSAALRGAAENGHLKIVQMLIPVSHPKAWSSCALRGAAAEGHLEVVRALVPCSDPKAKDICALMLAAMGGHVHVVRELIPVSELAEQAYGALLLAAESGHVGVVRELIKVCDPRARGSAALNVAADAGHHELVRVLAPLSDAGAVFQKALEELTVSGSPYANRVGLSRKVNALTPYVEKSLLEQAVLDLPVDMLKSMPQLASWRDAEQLRKATPSATPNSQRRSL